MMLRSSSTPILGSLLSSYSESPNHNHHCEFNSPKHIPKKLSYHQAQTAHLNLITPSSCSFNSSPSCNAELTSDDRHKSQSNGIRRAQSEGNLEGLLSNSCNSFDEFNHSVQTKKYPRKPNCSVLQTIPSFSVYNPRGRYEDDEEEEEQEGESGEESEEETTKIETSNPQSLMNAESKDLSMTFINQLGLQDRNLLQDESDNVLSKMHLARGLGVMTGGFNDGGGSHNEHKPRGFGGEGGDGVNIEEYYKNMVEENPSNPLFLRNYAQFLHQSKKDLGGAEEYYSRAILMDPGDGEILSQYAQLTWELHRDEERTSSYFERAVHASPEDSHVLAAYAGFLWETEEDENELCTMSPVIHENAIAAIY